jgi:hypothetical protein
MTTEDRYKTFHPVTYQAVPDSKYATNFSFSDCLFYGSLLFCYSKEHS